MTRLARDRIGFRSLLSVLLVLVATAPGIGRAAEQPSRIAIATSSPIDSLDPHLVLDTRRAEVRSLLYDGLFRWVDGPLRIVPWLAQSYTTSEDGRTFRFTLRKDAQFHDGRNVQASDVVYSVERILALKRGVAPLLSGFLSPGSTKAIDPQTVEFSLNRPTPLFLTLLPEIAIVNAELLKANELNNDWGRGWLQANEAGSGSYAFKSRSPTGALIAERFASHFGAEWPEKPIDEVELRPMLDPDERVESLLKGEVQVLQGNLALHQLKRLREAKDIAVVDSDSPRVFIGLMHAGREPFKSLAFRRAMAQAFDADRFIASELPAGSAPVAVPAPASLVSPPPGYVRPKYDLAAAAETLAKLKPAPREYTIGAIAGDPHSSRAALMMLDGLSKLGLAARIVAEPWPVIANRMRDEKQMYDILFLWRGTRYLDANNWLGELYDCDLLGAGNASWYCNKDADRLIKEARGTPDARARRQAFEKAAAILAEDQAGIFVASAKRSVAHLKRVKGLRLSPVGETIDTRMGTLE